MLNHWPPFFHRLFEARIYGVVSFGQSRGVLWLPIFWILQIQVLLSIESGAARPQKAILILSLMNWPTKGGIPGIRVKAKG